MAGGNLSEEQKAAIQDDIDSGMSSTIAEFRERTGDRIDVLINLLEQPDEYDSLLAAVRLRELGAVEAVPALIHALRKTDNGGIIAVYAICLGDLGDSSAVEPLIEVLQTADQRADAAAERTLADRPTGIWHVLRRMMHETWWEDTAETIRTGERQVRATRTIHSLAKLGDPRAIAPVRKWLSDPDERIQAAAIEALQALGAGPTPDTRRPTP